MLSPVKERPKQGIQTDRPKNDSQESEARPSRDRR